MRSQDRAVFIAAARQFSAWILVRRTNPASLAYVGRPGFTPKRIDCKAKTATRDVDRYQLKGLVVEPEIRAGAFDPGKLSKVKLHWSDMAARLGAAYQVDQDRQSSHYGCLRYTGMYVHADYDLYDVIDVAQPHRNLALVETLHGQIHLRGPKLLALKDFVNSRIGAPMVQHGGEAQYADHSEQPLDVFGPNGEEVTILNEFSVRHWYKERFGGRQTLGQR